MIMQMLGQIFGAIGGFLGKEFFGGGILSSIGRFAGKALGDYLEKQDYEPEEFFNFKNVRDSFGIAVASYGTSIPLVFGSVRIDGKIIWTSQIKRVGIQTTDKSYFTGSSDTKAIHHNTEFEYYLSFAVAICEGEVTEIARIWVDNDLINIGNYKFRLYKGTKNQLPDPLIASLSNGKATAYRDLAYIVFEDVNLNDFGNKIPIFSFEVTRKANIALNPALEDMVKSIVMIPGTGEYVYDTIVQHKIIKSFNNTPVSKQVINSHNYHNIANAVYSLNQLKTVCSNVEWVSPVVCWFGDSLDAAQCLIRPAVEFNDANIDYTESWRVAHYTRSTAPVVSRDNQNNPKYGGTINDASVVRYLRELKSRKLKVMFYPMFFLDVDKKPWRGHLTGTPAAVKEFFCKEWGYNNFILHYAELAKDHIDAFVIGSELIGLTKVAESPGVYPAVDLLTTLAQKVKAIVGTKVAVTYAADWSEYHHTDGGWYNLDQLWASPYIDFVGIDAYFPVTRTTNSNITPEEIVAGWEKGEGWDYYFDDRRNKKPLAPEYAWKNPGYWWGNYHVNPDGKRTEWRPKNKKIWFTEFGFPSIDKATNQPNVFFDPLCSDGGEPIYSTGEIDFSIQRKSIKAFIEYWRQKPYVGRMFLWTWDARPYPAWPHMNFWRDGYLWEKGHWVNNKFGAASIAAIILEISRRCLIDTDKVDVSSLDENIEGFVIDRAISANEAIDFLRICYFFDIKTVGDHINFVKRAGVAPYSLTSEELLKISDNSYLEEQAIGKASIISKLAIYFIDHSNEYKSSYIYINNENFTSKAIVAVKLPIVLSFSESERIGRMILNNAAIEDKVVKFIIPITSMQYEPADLITFTYLNQAYQIRIISIAVSGLARQITGIIDALESYYIPVAKTKLEIPDIEKKEIELHILDLPVNFDLAKPHLVAYLSGNKARDLYGAVLDNNPNYHKLQTLTPGAVVGIVVGFAANPSANVFVIDEISNFTVFCRDFTTFSEWNLCLIGNEIIRFKNWEKIEDNLYKISSLIRGISGTENFIKTHNNSERFIILNSPSNIIEISSKLESKAAVFKLNNNSNIRSMYFLNKSTKLLAPYIKQSVFVNNHLFLGLQERSHIDDWSSQPIKKKCHYIIQVDNTTILKTEDNEIIIDLIKFGLSAPVSFIIIMKDEFGNQSSPHQINVR
jgi:GTA TIM-barrel-like domain/Putative phage tail protein